MCYGLENKTSRIKSLSREIANTLLIREKCKTFESEKSAETWLTYNKWSLFKVENHTQFSELPQHHRISYHISRFREFEKQSKILTKAFLGKSFFAAFTTYVLLKTFLQRALFLTMQLHFLTCKLALTETIVFDFVFIHLIGKIYHYIM